MERSIVRWCDESVVKLNRTRKGGGIETGKLANTNVAHLAFERPCSNCIRSS